MHSGVNIDSQQTRELIYSVCSKAMRTGLIHRLSSLILMVQGRSLSLPPSDLGPSENQVTGCPHIIDVSVKMQLLVEF